jgi:thiol-disulfide isomerase/thioredoxin
MVDWDRVEQLRAKGWGWDDIAEDPKVGFSADSASGDPGRALRVLYHRRRARGPKKEEAPKKGRKTLEAVESRWTLLRVGYFLVPVVAIWFLFAYVAPSPVGILLSAIPYIALVLAGVVLLLLYALLRAEKRWTKVYRTTVVGGVLLGIVFAGAVALAGSLLFGCPYLPPSSSLSSQPGPGWTAGNMAPWHDSGKPVIYFYGASWCPYCSAGSWTIWKALRGFGTVTGNSTGFSSLSDVYAGTPEMILAGVQVSSANISFQVSEDTSGVDGTFPGTSNCYQAAYVSAYSGSAIPFLVVNGQAIHAGTPIVNPALLANFTDASTGGTGAGMVAYQVLHESGAAWNVLNTQTYWVMAYLAKACGVSNAAGVAYLAKTYGWTSATQTGVASDLAQIT